MLGFAADLSSFGFFQRGTVKEMMMFVGRTVARKTQIGQRQTVQQEEYYCHVYNKDGLVGGGGWGAVGGWVQAASRVRCAWRAGGRQAASSCAHVCLPRGVSKAGVERCQRLLMSSRGPPHCRPRPARALRGMLPWSPRWGWLLWTGTTQRARASRW